MPSKPPKKTGSQSSTGKSRVGKSKGDAGKLGTGSGRQLTVRVKKAKKLSVSSARWLSRQLNDPYVHAAKRDGYRSRAAYKLQQLDEKFSLIKPGMRIVDLGAAPGGWSQVLSEKVFKRGKNEKQSQIIALDILPMEPLTDVTIFLADFTADDAPTQIRAALNGKADLVLSDMAAPTTGHNATDHLRIIGLAEMAYDFARSILAPGGAFVCKLFQGGADKDLLATLKTEFATVKHAKPAASRSDSAETYVVAQGFRG
ncbi:MAG: RlmE family RNA methyltransferase [Alphaproteobacteria bacterium]|nr:RlmE family RNA methyltransferase [Alphaproteobacteria bacterium]